MPSRRICDDELYAHFLTFSCDRRHRLLDHNQPKSVVLEALNEQLGQQSTTCVEFVLIPNQVHAIGWFPERGQLSRFVREWKRRSSFHIRAWYCAWKAHRSDGAESGDRVRILAGEEQGLGTEAVTERIESRNQISGIGSGPGTGSQVPCICVSLLLARRRRGAVLGLRLAHVNILDRTDRDLARLRSAGSLSLLSGLSIRPTGLF